MILLIDNYDSFTWNLYDYALQCGLACRLFRNDEISIEEIDDLSPEGFIFSPGPREPSDHPLMYKILERYETKKPILGICLGYQAIGIYYGARLKRASLPMHGKTSLISHNNHPMYFGIPSPVEVCRYHSLILEGLGETPLIVTAHTDTGEPMSFAHGQYPIWAMQFHPEAILTSYGLNMMANWASLFR